MENFNLDLSKPEVMWVYQALVYMTFGLEHCKDLNDANTKMFETHTAIARGIALDGAKGIMTKLRAMIPATITNALDVAPKYEVSGLTIDEWVADYRESFKLIEKWLGVQS